MRNIEITEECLDFVDSQNKKVVDKFFQLINVMTEIRIVNSNFIKKLQSTQFYELRIKANNEYRFILFAVDHLNFAECKNVICLNGFVKKSTKDYKKAIKRAELILEDHLNKK